MTPSHDRTSSGDRRGEPSPAQSSSAASASPTKRNDQQEQPLSEEPAGPVTSSSTPTASAQRLQQGTAPTSIPKDRPCPFCHQLFTSSSLGRHLDLYIRERNPKAPDGIHDVEKIRKIRAGITRRQARGSGANGNKASSNDKDKHDSSPSQGSTPDPDADIRVETNRRAPPLDSARFSHGFHILNKADWTATGVINNLPPRSTTAPILSEARAMVPSSASSTRTDSALARASSAYYATTARGETDVYDARDRNSSVYPIAAPRQFAKYDPQQENASANARADAAERALKSVLESIRTAIARTHKLKLFDFDFFSMSFPALCLKILPPPNALESSTPDKEGRNSGCCSLEPPWHAQHEALKSLIAERIDLHQQNLQAYTIPVSADRSDNEEVGMSESERLRHLNHLLDSFSHWTHLTDKERQDSWQTELLRAYTQERERRKKAEASLEELQEEMSDLKAEQASTAVKPPAPYKPWSATNIYPPYNASSSSQYAPIQRPYNRTQPQAAASSSYNSSSSSNQAPPYTSLLNELLRFQERPEYGPWSNRSAMRHLPLETVQEITRLNASIGKWDYDYMIKKFSGPAAAAAAASSSAPDASSSKTATATAAARSSEPRIVLPSYAATSGASDTGGGGGGGGFTAASDWHRRRARNDINSSSAYEQQRGTKRQRVEHDAEPRSWLAGYGRSDIEDEGGDDDEEGEEEDEEDDEYDEEAGEAGAGRVRREYGAYDGHGNSLDYQNPRHTKQRQERTRQLIDAGRDTTATATTLNSLTRKRSYANGDNASNDEGSDHGGDDGDNDDAEMQDIHDGHHHHRRRRCRQRREEGGGDGGGGGRDDPDRRYRDLDTAILHNVIQRDRTR